MAEKSLPEIKKEMYMQEIMKKALYCIEKNTYMGTTIDMICEDVLISKRTFFNYFESKEGLVYELVNHAHNVYYDFVEKALEECSPEDALEKSIIYFVTSARKRFYNVTRTFWALTLTQDRFMELRLKNDRCNLDLFKRAVASMNRRFIFDDSEMLLIISGLIREVIAISSEDKLEANAIKWINNIIELCTVPME